MAPSHAVPGKDFKVPDKSPRTRTRLLLVDDEPGILQTLPRILEQESFEVTAVASVPEALDEIKLRPYGVLISDLNIGEPGDGFLVVSAMRRMQPSCINFILTGYPAFETALQAIRSQVDDYLVKPADVATLINNITQKLARPVPHRPLPRKQIAEILLENIDPIIADTLRSMKENSLLAAIPISDRGRVDHMPKLLKQLSTQLQTHRNRLPEKVSESAAEHGRVRREQGYTAALLVEDLRCVEQVLYSVIQDNLLVLDISNLMPDLKRLNYALDSQLRASLEAYLESKNAA